jgi:hypothetical protein
MTGDATAKVQNYINNFLTSSTLLPLFPRDILREVKESKGRFLVKDPNTEEWKEVNDEVAREKVAQVRMIGHKVSLVLARHI